MARILPCGTEAGVAPSWRLVLTLPGANADPAGLGEAGIAAPVPGTVAGALRLAGQWSAEQPIPLHGRDAWYLTTLEGEGPRRLVFEGLATLAEIWLDGEHRLVTDSMFRPHGLDVTLSGRHDLAVVFRALAPVLAKAGPRGRWRPLMATPGTLRNVRTTLLGHMPGWCPPIDVVGPYRPVTCRPPVPFRADLRADLDGAIGHLSLRLEDAGGLPDIPVRLRCAGAEAVLARTAPDRLEGALVLPGVAPWWPHTHGEPVLHPVEVIVGDERFDLGRTGFRRLGIDRGPDGRGFGLTVNDVPVFCRGAAWTPPDLAGLSGEAEDLAPALALVKEAGFNTLRLGGTMLYEADAFYRLCDELGILVWQDAMLANFDYPDDPAFRAGIAAEIEAFLDRTQTSPCLAVLCGGSEVAQQAAMLGFPAPTWSNALVRETIPAVASRLRPDLPYVENAPSGGDLPFDPRAGVAHYYGVGAYRRPLSDARTSGLRFAAECLGFANLPEEGSPALDALPPIGDPAWRARVPRDRGADWDFEDVRDHYLALLYGADPTALRRDDPGRYAVLSRAVVADVMEETLGAWRADGSPTRGALVWFLRDLAPGAGWGLIDAAGVPKSPWWALRRACRPLGLSITDEGLSGLAFHAWNETAAARDVVLDFACLTGEGRVAACAERTLTLAPRETASVSASTLLGRFFDTSYAYRFGPPAHAVTVARLRQVGDGAELAQAAHFPQPRPVAPCDLGMTAVPGRDDGGRYLDLAAARLALSVHVAAPGFRPEDDWFHLAPGRARRLRLTPLGARDGLHGHVAAANGLHPITFGDVPCIR